MTEVVGDLDYPRPGIVRREVEVVSFKLVGGLGRFPAHMLNFENLAP